ncbi:hypothetical protein BDY21DRAFT_76892 [Lineolata rhizophorae]|uniref:Uncharacterized protein n=1 Tax=Lineolata rhizophorae TaxID=578093 RepID=A0A6A6NU29_9PEZI|nr:hypothetical protein BDY21DRAFT_76892 [Lineolata rhizophorae]
MAFKGPEDTMPYSAVLRRIFNEFREACTASDYFRVIHFAHVDYFRHTCSLTAEAWRIQCEKIKSENEQLQCNDVAAEKIQACEEKLQRINCILLSASDAQTLNGIAILVSALIYIHTLDLYHLHLVYDIASFTSVSTTAAALSCFKTLRSHRATRIFSLFAFFVLYVAFLVCIANRLRGWDDTVPGQCYDTSLLAVAKSPHPYADGVYVGMTGGYMVVYSLLMLWAMLTASLKPRGMALRLFEVIAGGMTRLEKSIIILAIAQYPVHLYSVIAIKVSNTHLLRGESENSWGFGQIVAVTLLAGTLVECMRQWKSYMHWKLSRTLRDIPFEAKASGFA